MSSRISGYSGHIPNFRFQDGISHTNAVQKGYIPDKKSSMGLNSSQQSRSVWTKYAVNRPSAGVSGVGGVEAAPRVASTRDPLFQPDLNKTLEVSQGGTRNSPREGVRLPGYTGRVGTVRPGAAYEGGTPDSRFENRDKIPSTKIPGYTGHTAYQYERFGKNHTQLAFESDRDYKRALWANSQRNAVTESPKLEPIPQQFSHSLGQSPLKLHRTSLDEQRKMLKSEGNIQTENSGFVCGYTGHRTGLRDSLSQGNTLQRGATAAKEESSFLMRTHELSCSWNGRPSTGSLSSVRRPRTSTVGERNLVSQALQRPKTTGTGRSAHSPRKQPAPYIPGFSGYVPQKSETFGQTFGHAVSSTAQRI